MGFIFIFPLSLRKITHVVAPPQKLVMSLWNKEIFRPEAVTSGAGEGEDVGLLKIEMKVNHSAFLQ